jgi:predicted glycoside hydrolase/deacetylase ChbG (UPF0249 family)
LSATRLIVNADDFGRTPGINRGVLEAHRHGIVTSATAMVLEPGAAAGIREAVESAPRLSLGLHVVVTGGGRPASAAASVPNLAPGGRFVRKPEDLPGELPEEEVRRELSAQLAVFEAMAGRPPSHLDSHHHSALHPAIAPVFTAIAVERGLPVRGATAPARDRLRAAGLRVPDVFLDTFYATGATRENLRFLIERLEPGTNELMCHPGYADEELLRGSSYAAERSREVAALCDPDIAARIRVAGVELIGFREL